MRIFVNGAEEELTDHHSIHSFLHLRSMVERKGIAVALNEEIIPRQQWSKTDLKDGDKLLIIQASQGG